MKVNIARPRRISRHQNRRHVFDALLTRLAHGRSLSSSSLIIIKGITVTGAADAVADGATALLSTREHVFLVEDTYTIGLPSSQTPLPVQFIAQQEEI